MASEMAGEGQSGPVLSIPPPLQVSQSRWKDSQMASISENDTDLPDLPPRLDFSQPNKARGGPDLHLAVTPLSDALADILSNSGSYTDGDLVINSQRGLASQSDSGVTSLRDLEIIKSLGTGSSAIVQLVRHKTTGRLFALKELRMSVEEPVRSQIKKELQINQIQREHVVECYQTFYNDGRISIVLEFMDGGSLADVLKHQEKIPEPYLAEVARQALQGLLSLHRDHIIHRDIKPSNMLMNQNGQVKITDFGVSTLLTSTMDVGQTFCGTCTYMSPERISGDCYSYNSDTWALGLSVLECAIGHFPYLPPKMGGWHNFYELLNTVVLKPAPQAPTDSFSPEFCSFISDCLQKDPANRPTAAQALEHPFITKYKDVQVNIGDLCRRIEDE